MAITFVAPDVFSDTVVATSGPNANYYLWSNAANWSEGVPSPDSGGVIDVNGVAPVDDIADPAPTSLSLATGVNLQVDENLTVGALSLGDIGLYAQDGATVTIQGPVSGTPGGGLNAFGPGSVLTDDAPTDPGESYYVANGGMVFLAATPAGASGLEYQDGSTGTIALADPGATITADLFYVAGGDVLELPGTTVKNVTFGTSSLSVTTDAGSYDFTNVDYFPSPLAGYTSAVDPRTGLVAITFVAPDVFSDTVVATSGPNANYYLWSNAANWSEGVPSPDFGGVIDVNGVAPVDDIADPAPTSLSLGDGRQPAG